MATWPQRLADAYTAAWNTGKPDAVAAFFAPEGSITINAGEPWLGRGGVAAMATGFMTDIPDLRLVNDGVRSAGNHHVYLWTFSGTHAASGKRVKVSGWEEWDIASGGLIAISRGWFDADDYQNQTKTNQAT